MKNNDSRILNDNEMKILNCEMSDTEAILKLYEAARQLQKSKKMVEWPYFAAAFIEAEIRENRQWKLVLDDKMVCNWATTDEDRDIWGEREKGDAVYIHRIATDPDFRGNNFVRQIVEWARGFAAENGRNYIRLDTLGNNPGLIEHYVKAGFTFLGMVRLPNTERLPAHYQNEPNCNLFEISI